MKLRNIGKTRGPNDGSRTLFESFLSGEVLAALRDWIKGAKRKSGVLIGGLAVSYYVKPRTTQDVDVLFMSADEVPKNVLGFKVISPEVFIHIGTRIEIKIVTPERVNVPRDLMQQIVDTAENQQGIRVASPSGLVAAKLGRFSYQDRADIVALIKNGGVDLSGFDLPTKQLDAYHILVVDARSDPE